MGQTLEQSIPQHSSAQNMPQGKNSAKNAEKKAKGAEVASTRAGNMSPETRSSMAKSTSKISCEARLHLIEEAAYFRAEQRGLSGGDEMQDWLDAEAEVNAKFPG